MSAKKLQCMVIVLFLNDFVSSSYFDIGEGEKKCIFQEIPDDTTLIGYFYTKLYDKQMDQYLPTNQDLIVFVEAKDPDDELFFSQRYGTKGKFNFSSHNPGRYQICLQSSSSQPILSAGDVLRLHLDIRVAERTKSYAEIAAKDERTRLQLRVRQLTEQVQQIQRELDYQRIREKHFREVDHNINMWIFWWPLVRSLYMVAIVVWCTKSW